jgi:CRP-like cAMP-binding protein
VIVQVTGDAWRLSADAFRRLVDERPLVRRLLLRYSQYPTDQVSQHAACNQLHTVEAR